MLVLGLGLGACTGEPPVTDDDDAGSTTDPGETTSMTSSSSSEPGETTNSTSSTSSSETGETSSESDDVVFVPFSDIEGCQCDPFAQDCPEGEKCVPYSSAGDTWDANKCVPVTGEGQVGEPCSSQGPIEATDSCGADSICWDVQEVDGDLLGVCTGFCSGTADAPSCPQEGSFCMIANSGSITLCVDECDPFAQDCPEGLMCVWANTGFSCVVTMGGIGPGDSCSQIADCGAGLLCVDGAAVPGCVDSACCTSLCSLAEPSCPWAETACVPFFANDPPPGYEDTGVCMLPEPP